MITNTLSVGSVKIDDHSEEKKNQAKENVQRQVYR
jgi:hypothetical protein